MDELISGSEIVAVLDEKRYLQNWMNDTREMFIAKIRDKIVEDGKK